MAEPGDPNTPDTAGPTPSPEVDHDDLVGFSSPRSLEGRPRMTAEPDPDVMRAPEPDPAPTEPASTPQAEAAPQVVQGPAASPHPAQSQPDPSTPPPTPSWAQETPRPGPPPSAALGDADSLFSVYALILFAVPTLGVSALIALVAVTGRPGPSGEAAMSHFIYQQRTLWAGAVAALLGAILIAVGLGVFVLFALAVWLILRGVSGVWALKAGRPIAIPRGWWI